MEKNLLDQMKDFACKCCGQQEQCERGLREKLKKKFRDAESKDVDEVINWLKRIGALDELRYANAFFHDKIFLNKWGLNKVIMHLKAKGVVPKIIAQAQQELDKEKYFAVAKQVCDEIRKHEDDKNKIFKRLLARGFQLDTIKRFL